MFGIARVTPLREASVTTARGWPAVRGALPQEALATAATVIRWRMCKMHVVMSNVGGRKEGK